MRPYYVFQYLISFGKRNNAGFILSGISSFPLHWLQIYFQRQKIFSSFTCLLVTFPHLSHLPLCFTTKHKIPIFFNNNMHHIMCLLCIHDKIHLKHILQNFLQFIRIVIIIFTLLPFDIHKTLHPLHIWCTIMEHCWSIINLPNTKSVSMPPYSMVPICLASFKNDIPLALNPWGNNCFPLL